MVKVIKLRHHAKLRRNRSTRGRDMAIFRFFKMAAAAILVIENVDILGAGSLETAKVHHRAKFRGVRPNRC